MYINEIKSNQEEADAPDENFLSFISIVDFIYSILGSFIWNKNYCLVKEMRCA